ncbi:NAD(P)/FAD-dependent oxidoreductase [Sphingomonas sp. SRS2]|uniref:NAD(P)/FAD-dependent oxidoreductase n=1 Tax=Sphingomonas sp. SRS2 TaxID=133190 RepID=UPI000618453B|nr:FAD-dependent oxidoreductase [Sphingomonas sp. SRS2]KKC24407.1 FAD-dependent oxidoreductase [Sphingomonas sp. SRS2]
MNGTIISADIAIVGAGMAGASLAAEIGDAARVVLIEGEDQPGYHSTGRSAAFWQETYGGPAVQPLTSASRTYLADNGFLSARGAVHVGAGVEGVAAIDAILHAYGAAVQLRRLDPAELSARVPGLRPGVTEGLAEPSCRDIDVAGLHAHYLSRAKRAGAILLTDARVEAIHREGDLWRLDTRAGQVNAPLIVNAAGAWAGGIAALAGAQPIDIQPYRRTVIQLEVDPPATASLPLVMDAAETFYFKPEAGGRIWLSPHDETLTPPCDAAPEELDIAVAIDRFEKTVDWRVVRRERAWAGLRSFAPDRVPVYGFDRRAPGFFWFAGQGGFGIQTAPAAAMIASALLLGRPLPAAVGHIDPAVYDPCRFGQS